jgi:predicted RNA binding protein YcfA (HicA-like mRNA interferase family)
MPKKLSNVTIKEYRSVLTQLGCSYIRTSGGHEIWTRKDLTRPITFQTHIDPVPERIIKQCFIPLGIDRGKFLELL